jgi:hypothetical protein
MVYYSSTMHSKKGGAMAVALLLAIAWPQSASAQADVAWSTSPFSETLFRPIHSFRADDPMPEFTGGFAPYRTLVTAEESSEDRERRIEGLSKCMLLSEISGHTILDMVAGIPNQMIDLVAGGVQPAPERGDCWSLRTPDGSILSRMFACSIQDPSDRPFNDLFEQLLLREQRYFARFQDSDLSTVGVEDGVEDINTEGLMSAQRKLLFDAARKLYFGRLGNRVDDRLREESLDIGRWHTIDYAVAPAVIAGYFYIRGWEKKFDLLGLRCGFEIEPLKRILERMEGSHNDLVSAASLEFGLGDFPVKMIVSFGIQDGDPLCDFIGIGTSVGKAKQIVGQEMIVNPEE